jgi:GST-like protein
MIEMYVAATGNGRRPLLMLEECGIPYTLTKVDLTKGEQKSAAFTAMNPAAAIPVMKDGDLVLSQGAAMLLHLAETTGRFLPKDRAARAKTLQWLMFAVTDCAPASSAIFYAGNVPEKSAPTIAAFEDRLLKMFGVADAQLAKAKWLAGDEMTVADIAFYPVVQGRVALIDKAGGLASLKAWAAKMAARPAIAKAMAAV